MAKKAGAVRPFILLTVVCPACGSHLEWPSHRVRDANPDWRIRDMDTSCPCGWQGKVRFFQEQT